MIARFISIISDILSIFAFGIGDFIHKIKNTELHYVIMYVIMFAACVSIFAMYWFSGVETEKAMLMAHDINVFALMESHKTYMEYHHDMVENLTSLEEKIIARQAFLNYMHWKYTIIGAGLFLGSIAVIIIWPEIGEYIFSFFSGSGDGGLGQRMPSDYYYDEVPVTPVPLREASTIQALGDLDLQVKKLQRAVHRVLENPKITYGCTKEADNFFRAALETLEFYDSALEKVHITSAHVHMVIEEQKMLEYMLQDVGYIKRALTDSVLDQKFENLKTYVESNYDIYQENNELVSKTGLSAKNDPKLMELGAEYKKEFHRVTKGSDLNPRKKLKECMGPLYTFFYAAK